MTYAGNAENLRTIEKRKNYHYIRGDICCQKTVRKILEEYEPDVIVHFAAESHVDRSIDGPVEFFQTNVIGTLNLLHESNKWLKKIERRFRNNFRFIHISTDEVYGSLGYEGNSKKIQLMTLAHHILHQKPVLIIWLSLGIEHMIFPR